MEEFASGGTFKEISKTNFGHLEIPLPTVQEQLEIVERVHAHQQKIGQLQREIEEGRLRIQDVIDGAWAGGAE
jgi:restriction endonuclease S subunit